MKHTAKILAAFVSLFLLSQIIGLYLLSLSVQSVIPTPTGGEVVYANTSIGARPDVQGYNVLLYIGIGVLIGTVLLLLIAKFNKVRVWKVWFLLAAWMTMSISLGAIFGEKFYWIAWVVGAALAVVKILYHHPIIHNLTELLMYSGLALLFAPLLTVPVAILLLVAISIYDAYAVWKSKHMVTLAEFTKKSNLFPGLAFTYSEKNNKTTILTGHHSAHDKSKAEHKDIAEKTAENKTQTHSKSQIRIGVLGGGDVIFPMLFAGAVFTRLIATGYSSVSALALSLVVSLGAAAALTLLFVYGKKERYYPAMPFISAGCLAGFAVMHLIMIL